MASSTTLSPAISPYQLCSGRNGMNLCRNVTVAKFGKGKRMKVRCVENDTTLATYGSQYNNQGKVVRRPAPLSLALAHADITDGKVVFVPWVETDFKTGENH